MLIISHARLIALFDGMHISISRSKIKQQIRHFLGFQDMWFALARSNGLSLRDRLQVFLTISSPILLAVVCPFAALGVFVLVFQVCEVGVI